MNLILFGPGGSGKGTQAKILSKKLNIPHISTGEIFRAHIKKQTKLGKKINLLVKQGKLIADEITNQIIKERLNKSNCKNGFILDGYPRNLEQAKFLDKIAKIDSVLEIWINDKEAINRINQRRTCLKCNVVYNLKYNPPKQKNICDLCNSKLCIREDDKKQVILKRLQEYRKQAKILIKYYKNIYKKINGMPDIQIVSQNINTILT